jgi:isopentenyldiphosphate isomerase
MSDNPDEWFDVVDGGDRVVGRARRGEVHARGLRHRAVHVLIRRGNGDFFLQRRSMGKDSHPGRWDSSASGHLDAGEDYAPAAGREVREELGIELDRLDPVGSLPASERTGHEFVRIYAGLHPGPFRLHPEEIMDGRWVAPEALEAWLRERPGDFPPCFHEVWTAAAPRLGIAGSREARGHPG